MPTTVKYKEIVMDLIRAWESLPGGREYSPTEVGQWLEKKMSPAFNRARRALDLPIPTRRQKRGLPHG